MIRLLPFLALAVDLIVAYHLHRKGVLWRRLKR